MDSALKTAMRCENSLFSKLNQEQIKALYSIAPIKRLKEEQILIKEGDQDQTVYLVLDGEIRIVKDFQGQNSLLGTVGKGCWLGEISFTRKIPRTASAVANKPSTVMAIEEATLGALDEDVQLLFLKQMNELSYERIRELETEESRLLSRNRRLMDNLFNAHVREQPDYDGSEAIHKIIQKIPQLPTFVGTLSVKLFEEGTTVKEIADTIKQDPSLLGLVMKRINSSYYGFQNKISDIDRAILLIGFNGLYQLVVSEGARRTMPDRPYFRELHAHLVSISNISYFLSQVTKTGIPAEIVTIGLLHDLGNIVTELLKDQNPNLRFLLNSLDPAQMGSILLKKWGLPKAVWNCIGHQNLPMYCPPSKVPRETVPNVALLFVSHLIYEILQGHSDQDLSDIFLEDYKKVLNLGRYSLMQCIETILLPIFKKSLRTFPEPFRNLIVGYLETDSQSGEQPPYFPHPTTAP